MSDINVNKQINARQEILEVLYEARAKHPNSRHAFFSLRSLEKIAVDCDFALSVLVELGFVHKNGFLYKISASGVLAFEQQELADV